MGARATDKATDERLLELVALGSEAAFSELYRRHVDAVTTFVRRRVQTPEIAFDLAAETFAAVIVGAGNYRGDSPALGWIFGIARNKLHDSLRRGEVEASARRRLAFEPIALDDEAIERVEQRASAGSDALTDALAALPDGTREAVLARVVDEDSYESIATRLKCSQHVVRKRVQRGLDALRLSLKEDA